MSQSSKWLIGGVLATPVAGLTAIVLIMSALGPTGIATADELPCQDGYSGGVEADGAWREPLIQRYHVSSPYGVRPSIGEGFHQGVDLTTDPKPGPVVAASSGTVFRAGSGYGTYGNSVWIQHAGGVQTGYGHLASIAPNIKVGAKVSGGQLLGEEGSTGRSTGPHLHFEVDIAKRPTDPVKFMESKGVALDGVASPPAPKAAPKNTTPKKPGPPGAAGSTAKTKPKSKVTGKPVSNPEAEAGAKPKPASPPEGEGGMGFKLPAPGQPRKDSLHNKPLPIPAAIKGYYVAAGKRYGLPWPLLAGIGMEETAHGKNKGTSSAGAQGLMQFMSATFRSMGVDGDGDGKADINNDADSAMSAANYLTKSGALRGADGVRRAIHAYNHADWYVNDVLFYAQAYGSGTVLGEVTPCDPTGEGEGNPNLPPITEARVRTALMWAERHVGARYVLGAEGPNAWDCSSFTRAAYGEAQVSLPRTAQAQRDWLARGNGKRVQLGQEKPGDLVFWDSYRGPNAVGHVVLVQDPATHTSVEAMSPQRGVTNGDYTRKKGSSIYEIWRPGNVSSSPKHQ